MSRRSSSGFSLIELMIVVAIISLLATIAYPAYTQYVEKSKRAVAKSMLLQIAGKQEQYFLDNKKYASALTALNYPATLYVDGNSNPATAAAAIYKLEITASTNTTFTLAAIPQNAQAGDTTCGNFTLDNKGTKGVSGSGSVAECW